MRIVAIIFGLAGLVSPLGCCKNKLSPEDVAWQKQANEFNEASFQAALKARGFTVVQPPMVSDGGSDAVVAAGPPADGTSESLPKEELVSIRYSEDQPVAIEFVQDASGTIFQLRRLPQTRERRSVTLCGCVKPSWDKGVAPGTYEMIFHIPRYGGTADLEYDVHTLSQERSGGRCKSPPKV